MQSSLVGLCGLVCYRISVLLMLREDLTHYKLFGQQIL